MQAQPQRVASRHSGLSRYGMVWHLPARTTEIPALTPQPRLAVKLLYWQTRQVSRAAVAAMVGGVVIAIEVWQDAVELARAVNGRINNKSVFRAIVSNDSFRITTLSRLRDWARRWHIPLVNHALRVVQTAVFGVEIGTNVTLGHGVYFIHPNAIVIGGDAFVGNRVRFMGCNTVGTAKDNGYPIIEDDVTVGAGARILGPVRIGARAVIGANAVVTRDVPADHTAVGVPARAYRQTPRNRNKHNRRLLNVKELLV